MRQGGEEETREGEVKKTAGETEEMPQTNTPEMPRVPRDVAGEQDEEAEDDMAGEGDERTTEMAQKVHPRRDHDEEAENNGKHRDG